jgi:hypothetical protein
MQRRCLGLLLGLAFVISTPVLGQNASFSGYMFGDVYYLASHDDEGLEDDLEGANGLWFRRIYVTFDFGINDRWSARVRTEMNSPGDFVSKEQLIPTVKDAYAQWKKGNHQINLGLSSTPTFAVIEDVWGYRALEKTLVDLQKIGPSRDMGVAFKGSLDRGKVVRYNVMLANGNSTSSESNQGKKVLVSLGVHLPQGLILEGYADYEDRPGETDRYTVQGFAGFQHRRGRLGVQYVHQNREVEGGESLDVNGLSLFGVLQVTDNVSVYARYDRMLDANPDAAGIGYLPFDPNVASNMVLAGFDVQLHRQVHLMPNMETVFYGSDGPDATILPRLTFWVIFN